MNQPITSFKDSQEATFRRRIREAIRKGPFTKGQRDALLAFMNHWMHHRKSKDGIVHPGRKKIAKQSGVTIKTVSRLFNALRLTGVITAEDSLHGLHGNATEYSVNVMRLLHVCAMSKTDWRRTVGHLSQLAGETKCPTVLSDGYNVINFPSQQGCA